MKKQLKNITASGMIVMLIAACSHNAGYDGGIRKQDAGTLVGAVGGAWAGSNVGKGKGNVAAIAVGTLLGAYLGNQVGASMDRADLAYYNNTSQEALETNPTGQTSRWYNPDSGNSGTVTPTKTYQVASGSYCREYSQTIVIGGRTEEAFGTACRQPDGTWKIQ